MVIARGEQCEHGEHLGHSTSLDLKLLSDLKGRAFRRADPSAKIGALPPEVRPAYNCGSTDDGHSSRDTTAA